MNYALGLTFKPDQYNAGRKDHAGVWRVASVIRCHDKPPIEVMGSVMMIPSARPYTLGAIVNPRRIVEEFMSAAEVIYFGSAASG